MSMTVTLIVPVFNESNRLNEDYFSQVSSIPGVYIIFVDDASSDNSVVLLQEMESKNDKMEVVTLTRNVGKANAIRAGWIHAVERQKSDVFGFLDADGAFSIYDINEIITKFNQRIEGSFLIGNRLQISDFDSIWSSRIQLSGRRIGRSRGRFLLGRALATLIKLTFKGLPWDTQSGFKLFRNSELFRSAIQNEFKCKWLFDIELLLRIRKSFDKEYSVWEEPLSVWNDIPGSKVGFKGYGRILKDFIILFFNNRMRELP